MPSKGTRERRGFFGLESAHGYQPTEVGPRGNPPNMGSGGKRRDTEVRIRGSLEVHIGQSPTEPAEIERLAAQARAAGVIVFTKPMLDRMDTIARLFIEGEHKRMCERGGR